ncbi:hypothetical protein ANN_11761 [Periplaneta americana]|uniref:Uncharacterized protein n=1 Tax=Periplaneta americana TaxID=6978 RepID=A0ABQ8T7E7_PERAM|nr:hypothetical protein ANN_11761 [Periplaneta americana]
MAGLCKGGNEPSGSLKARMKKKRKILLAPLPQTTADFLTDAELRLGLVGRAAGYGLEGRSSIPCDDGIFLVAKLQNGPEVHSASYIIEYRVFPGKRRSERGADHTTSF